MSKRSRGDGAIVKRKDGRWQGSLQVDGKRRTVYGKTEREARAKLRELQREAENTDGLPVSERHTLNELLDAWVANAQRQREDSAGDQGPGLGRFPIAVGGDHPILVVPLRND